VAAVNIQFPGNLAQVDTAADLRDIPSSLIASGTLYLVSALEGVFEYDSGSRAADDGKATIRPADRSPLEAGRWIKNAGGLARGPQGLPGEGLEDVMAPGGSALVGYDARKTVKGKLDLMVYATDARFAGGAVGDGVADDRPALQAAIDWLASEGGGTLMVPVGTYRMTFALAPDGGICCLVLKPGVSIVGENRYASILRVSTNLGFGAGTYFRGICTNGRTGKVLLSNFTFDGNRDGQGAFRDAGNGGNIVVDCSSLVIDGVESINANGQGIQARGGPTNPMEVVRITNCYVAGCSGSTINQDGSVAAEYNGNGIGIQIGWAKDYLVTGNMIRACKDNAIDTYNESGSFDAVGGGGVISDNVLRSCRVGVFPETSSRTIVSNNYIEDMNEAGVALNRINSAPSAMVVKDNTIRTTLVGVRISGNMESATIRGNFIENITAVSGGCIGVYNGANILIEGNEFKPNNPDIPLIRTGDNQAVNMQVGQNYFWGTPSTDRMIFMGAADHFAFNTWGPMTPINNGGNVPAGEGGTMFRNNVRFSTLKINGAFAANGADPRGKYTLPAAGTDPASTQALANALADMARAFGFA